MRFENIIELLRSNLERVYSPRAKIAMKCIEEIERSRGISDPLVVESLYYLAKKIPVLSLYKEPWRSKEFRLFMECFTLSDYYRKILNNLVEMAIKGIFRRAKISHDRIVLEFYPGSGVGIEVVSRILTNKLAIVEFHRRDLEFVMERLAYQNIDVIVYEVDHMSIGDVLSYPVGMVLIVSPLTWFYSLSELVDRACSILERGGYILGISLLDNANNILKPFMVALGVRSLSTLKELEILLASKHLSRMNIKEVGEFILYTGVK